MAYWIGGAGAFLYPPLADFYTSSVASFLNVVLYPAFAMLVLSLGWIRAWISALDYVRSHPEAENILGWEWKPDTFDFQRDALSESDDPSDPTSSSAISNAIVHRMFER